MKQSRRPMCLVLQDIVCSAAVQLCQHNGDCSKYNMKFVVSQTGSQVDAGSCFASQV